MGSGSVKGIQIHDKREKEGISHTNKDIDWDRTKLNYDLHPAQNSNFNSAVKRRIEQLSLKKAVRKDAVVMAQVLVTSDNDFFKGLSSDQQKQFFKDSYDFLADRYGKENIISATVHLDEQTPHMHFNFVPVTDDGRLSAKSVLNRQALIEQQDDFVSAVGKKYGLQRGVRSDERREHLETAEYKLKTTLQQTEKAEQQLEKLQGKIMKEQEVNALNGKKTLTGGLKGVSYQEYLSLKKTAQRVEKTQKKVQSLTNKLNEVIKERDKALSDNQTIALGLKMKIAGRESQLQNKLNEVNSKYIALLKEVIDIKNNLSPESRQEFERLQKTYEKTQVQQHNKGSLSL